MIGALPVRFVVDLSGTRKDTGQEHCSSGRLGAPHWRGQRVALQIRSLPESAATAACRSVSGASRLATPVNRGRTSRSRMNQRMPAAQARSGFRDDRNRFDLDARILREPGHFDRGTGGRHVAEIGPVHGIHRREIVHVLEEDRRLDDRPERCAGGFEDRLQVLEDLAGLLADIAGQKFARGRDDGDLPGGEDECSAGDDALTVRTDGAGCCRCADDTSFP